MESAERHIAQNIRTFIGVRVHLDETTADILRSVRSALKTEKIRWTKPENFHITILFIGDTSPEMARSIQEALDIIASRNTRFSFTLSGIGVFRSINHPRVLWMGVKDPGSLADLKKMSDKILLPALGIRDTEKFSPHLTLGRMKRIENLRLLEDVLKKYYDSGSLEIWVEEIIFYESKTSPAGAEYYVISSHPLKKNT